VALALAPGLPASAQPGPTVTTRDDSTLGTVLADSAGMSLYMFKRDTADVSTCTGNCAATWPPLLVQGDPVAGDRLLGSLGVLTRDDGGMQVTYDGMPLYYYASDTQPGDTKGQGVGGAWYLVTPQPAATPAPANGAAYGGQ